MISSISETYKQILQELAPFDASLVAVSKRQPLDKIKTLYDIGHRDFGENRVQEFLGKYDELPHDIKWHLIGHLQTNKVNSIIGKVHLIHSVDRLKLARKINEESANKDIHTPVLLQIKIAQEDSKFGYEFEELVEHLSEGHYSAFQHLDIRGVMGMATFTDNEILVRSEFKKLHQYFSELKSTYFKDHNSFHEISMGMSGDYTIALEEGATFVRIGSKLFGERD
jgi:pyridoxal phosphate enzyme (YggS family)